MSDETYNGWKNRETWALQLWLSNDQGLYELTRERVSSEISERGQDDTREVQARMAGEVVRCLWEELTDPSEGLMSAEKILEMVRDIGSEYRVDWDSIGAAWLDDSE